MMDSFAIEALPAIGRQEADGVDHLVAPGDRLGQALDTRPGHQIRLKGAKLAASKTRTRRMDRNISLLGGRDTGLRLITKQADDYIGSLGMIDKVLKGRAAARGEDDDSSSQAPTLRHDPTDQIACRSTDRPLI